MTVYVTDSGASQCIARPACTDRDYYTYSSTCDSNNQVSSSLGLVRDANMPNMIRVPVRIKEFSNLLVLLELGVVIQFNLVKFG